jgi:hypothetical protein
MNDGYGWDRKIFFILIFQLDKILFYLQTLSLIFFINSNSSTFTVERRECLFSSPKVSLRLKLSHGIEALCHGIGIENFVNSTL